MSSPGAEPDGAVSDDELLALQLEQRQLDIDREFQQKQLDLDRKMNELRRRRATKSQTPTDLLTPDRNESSQVKAEPTNNHAQISDMPEQATQSSLQSPTSTSETLKPRTATVGVNRYERSPSVGGSGPRFYAERGGTVNHHSSPTASSPSSMQTADSPEKWLNESPSSARVAMPFRAAVPKSPVFQNDPFKTPEARPRLPNYRFADTSQGDSPLKRKRDEETRETKAMLPGGDTVEVKRQKYTPQPKSTKSAATHAINERYRSELLRAYGTRLVQRHMQSFKHHSPTEAENLKKAGSIIVEKLIEKSVKSLDELHDDYEKSVKWFCGPTHAKHVISELQMFREASAFWWADCLEKKYQTQRLEIVKAVFENIKAGSSQGN